MVNEKDIRSPQDFEVRYENVVPGQVNSNNVYEARKIAEEYVAAHPEDAAKYFSGTAMAGVVEDALRDDGESHLANTLAKGMVLETSGNNWTAAERDRRGPLSKMPYPGRKDVSYVGRDPLITDLSYHGFD